MSGTSSGPEVLKLFFMLNSNEHEMSTLHKNKMLKINDVPVLELSNANKC